MLRWPDHKNPLAIDVSEISIDIGFHSAPSLSFLGSLITKTSLLQAFSIGAEAVLAASLGEHCALNMVLYILVGSYSLACRCPHLNGPDRVLDDVAASLLIDTPDGGWKSPTGEKVQRFVTRTTLQTFVDAEVRALYDAKFQASYNAKLYLVIP